MSDSAKTESEPDADYQIGAHSVSTDGVSLGEGGEFVEFEMEMQTVFKRLADDIYESDDAGIREPLTNAITAILRAQRDHDVGDRGVIEFSLRETEDGGLSLTISDNGIGITEAELREVLSVIGRSTTRDDGELVGQFGMGFLAVFKLVGTDGGFVMHTHSRKKDAEPVSGVWRSGGFTIDTDDEIPGKMDDDEYGTRFEFILRDDITKDDVRGWVQKHSKWARVPVIYNEYDSNGVTVVNEDYGVNDFTSEYDEERPVLTFETDYFRAVMSPDADKRTILLDVPIRRNHYTMRSLPTGYSVDIRLKHENSIVVTGPHEGLMPLEDTEYDAMPAERREQYIPKGELTDEDVVMPGPIGTRDSLASNKTFWAWLGDRLNEQHTKRGAEICEQFTNDREAVKSLAPEEFERVVRAVEARTGSVDGVITNQSVQGALQSAFGVAITNEDVLSYFAALVEEVTVISEGQDVTADKEERMNKRKSAWAIDNPVNTEDDGGVYMGRSLNQQRAELVWADEADNVVVEVPSADHYEQFEEELGWEKLRTVSVSAVKNGDFTVDERTKEQFLNEFERTTTEPEDIEDQSFVIRFGPDEGTFKMSLSAIADHFERTNLRGPQYIDGNRPEMLVIFPDRADANVQDYYDAASPVVPIARVSRKAAEYLSNVPCVYTFEEYEKCARGRTLKTNYGDWWFDPDRHTTYYHILSEDVVDVFRQQDALTRVPYYLDALSTEEDHAWEYPRETIASNLRYVPVTRSEFANIELLVDEGSGPAAVVAGDETPLVSCTTELVRSDTVLYAYCKLADTDRSLSEQDESVSFLLNSHTSLEKGGRGIVDELAEAQT